MAVWSAARSVLRRSGRSSVLLAPSAARHIVEVMGVLIIEVDILVRFPTVQVGVSPLVIVTIKAGVCGTGRLISPLP
jgi:hypothetical protein